MEPSTVLVQSVDHNGQGVARTASGKIVFIYGALAGEEVAYQVVSQKKNYAIGQLLRIIRRSPSRTTPLCTFFGRCGGCQLQHIDQDTQVAIKQRALEDALQHIGGIKPRHVLSPITGPAWAYRQRARLSVRYVPKKKRALVGFREKKSTFITDMNACAIVPHKVSQLLPALSELVTSLSCPRAIPQIEVSVGDESCVLVLRHITPLTAEDQAMLAQFEIQQDVYWWTQAGGPHTAQPLAISSRCPALFYRLPEFDLKIFFQPTQFTQVNAAMNNALVKCVLSGLAPQPKDVVADLFCGLGNLSLPIARYTRLVIGFEGQEDAVQQAQYNAQYNHLDQKARFIHCDLYKTDYLQLQSHSSFNKIVIDPPREGALRFCRTMQPPYPEKIVYVSCNPATLARDAAILQTAHQYTLTTTSVLNMFPHTTHVESMSVFHRADSH